MPGFGESSTVVQIRAHSNGLPLIGKTKEFKPPVPELETEDVSDGHFIKGRRVKGANLSTWSFKQEGMTQEQAKKLGVTQGKDYALTFKESGEDDEGNEFIYVHEITGRVTKAAKESSKQGDENVWDIEGFARTYKLTINSEVIHDINIKTQKLIYNGEDMTAKHLQNVS
jgi:hypothetical protein